MLRYNAVPIPTVAMSTDAYSVNGFTTPLSTILMFRGTCDRFA